MTDDPTKGNWERVGVVGVDTGHVVVSDAAEEQCEAILKAWDDANFHTDSGVTAISAQVGPRVFEGVICESGGGDGGYDVFVRREDYGWGPVVTGLFVDFTLRD